MQPYQNQTFSNITNDEIASSGVSVSKIAVGHPLKITDGTGIGNIDIAPNQAIVTGIGDSTILEGLRKIQEQWLVQNKPSFISYGDHTSSDVAPGSTPAISYTIQITMGDLANEILAGNFSRVSSKSLLAMLVAQKKFQEAIDKAKEKLGLDF